MASMVLGSIGSSLLGPLGGFLGSTLGGMVDQMIFGGGENANRIDDLKVTRADPGAAIPLLYGADRLPGTVICTSDLIETKNKEKFSIESLFGKGGQITYTYHVHIDYLLCEGPILGVGRIWADGNLARGTQYEMECDTAKHPQNIGGIPYPPYYQDHLYSPKKIPWTIDRAAAPNPTVDDGKYYRSNSSRNQMIQITAAEANKLLKDTKVVVYWKDTSTGYYIPVEQSHGYTGEEPIEYESGSILQREDMKDVLRERWSAVAQVGDGWSGEWFTDLGDYYEDPNFAASKGGYMDLDFVWDIWSNVDAFLTVETWSIHFYTGADDEEIIDGQHLGNYLGQGFPQSVTRIKTANENTYKQYVDHVRGVPIPENTRYIVMRFTILPVMWVFTAVRGRVENNIIYHSIDKKGDELRNWPDYWNLYDAINDWSHRAVLAFDGPDDIVVYHGGEYQPQDQTMKAAMIEMLAEGYERPSAKGSLFGDNEEYEAPEYEKVDAADIDVPAYLHRAHVVFDTLQLERYSNRIPQFTFEVVQYDDVRVPDVVRDIMERAEVPAKHYDLEGITDERGGYHVLGYSVSSKMNFKAALEAMLEAFSVDVAEIGNQLVFRDKYREADWTIPRSALAAVDAGDKLQEDVRYSFRNPVDMPRRLTVRFKDTERNYQANVAHYQRQQGIQVQDSGTELPVVLPPHVAKAYARSKMRDIWLERVQGRMEAPHEYVYIAPSDIVEIDGEGVTDNVTFKAMSVTRGDNGIIELEGSLHDVELINHGMPDNVETDKKLWGHMQSVPNSVPATVWRLLDLPPLLENHDTYGAYLAMSGTSTSWRGALLYRSVDGGNNWSAVSAVGAAAGMGNVVSNPLPYHDAERLDLASKMRVKFFNPYLSLASCTVDELTRGYNPLLVGNEVVQYMNATQIDANTWEFSTFLRGRRGTDLVNNMNSHFVGEEVIVLQPFVVVNYADSLPHVKQELHYKGGTAGRLLDEMTTQTFTNTGKRITPLSPYGITATRDGSNNLTITWIRRDRLYQTQYDGADLRNSEDTLEFEVDIMSGSTVLRTISVANAVEAVYSATDQTTDGITPGDPVPVEIYQLSATIGRGNKGAAVV